MPESKPKRAKMTVSEDDDIGAEAEAGELDEGVDVAAGKSPTATSDKKAKGSGKGKRKGGARRAKKHMARQMHPRAMRPTNAKAIARRICRCQTSTQTRPSARSVSTSVDVGKHV